MKSFKKVSKKTKELINNLRSLDQSADDNEFIDKRVNLGIEDEDTLTKELKYFEDNTVENNLDIAKEITKSVGEFNEKDLKFHSKQRLGYGLGILSILIILGVLVTLITLFSLGLLNYK
ncbi:hypothetical protein NPA08_02880 [Mycoplasmopsis citelli]|uniref:Uncharacterized protein n=1 Tax=Mycoplasmopsis citelli TaxID=171281 RepID=A0A449B1H4_9BACT|nr:hypothetical protein [Mycoplasmopsis citelli]UUD35889.1 hypothetical protein NPA08_02880 [Mycoplasmopsis citelli]VEU74421.1 Uncharacterised protein [Mycoplasmopsis citelli]